MRLVSLALSSRPRLNRDSLHTSSWLLTPIPNVTIRSTSNNNSLSSNHSPKCLSSFIITSVHTSYMPNHKSNPTQITNPIPHQSQIQSHPMWDYWGVIDSSRLGHVQPRLVTHFWLVIGSDTKCNNPVQYQ